MSALFPAKRTAICRARDRLSLNGRIAAALTLAAWLSACVPATTPLAGSDPANPAAKVAAVGYRSTIAPYSSQHPVTPAPWRERNDGDAPQPKSDR